MVKKIQDVYVVSAMRTPVGKAKGVFRASRPDDMLAFVLKTLLETTPQIEVHQIDDVIIGCAMPEGEQGMNVARIASLLAGFPPSIPAFTLNRFCASGLQAIALAAERIAIGEAEAIIAGGVESMSRVPMGGFKFTGNPRFFEPTEEHLGIAFGMGITAEKVAAQWQVGREAQDEYALESHRRALKAIERGEFKDEIIPYPLRQYGFDDKTGKPFIEEKIVSVDQGPRAGSTLEALQNLKPVFALKGTVTAGNSSQMSDGAAAVLVVGESFLQRHNIVPMARFSGFSVAGVPPEIMGIGPIEAIPKLLKRLALSQDDIDWIELNEAFAAQTLAVIEALGLDRAKVNPLGGGIALGHPLGATGAIRSATLLHALKREHLKYGMVTMCVGTGMGAAGIFEAV